MSIELCCQWWWKWNQEQWNQKQDGKCDNPEIVHVLIRHLLTPLPWVQENTHSDLFSIKQLTTNNHRNTFTAKLNLSPWSDSFVHGANMMPSMIEWFNNFLNNQKATLDSIDEIKFKKKIIWNIQYTILEKESQTLKENSNILGHFSDNNWKVYHFYGEAEKRLIKPEHYMNYLPIFLLWEDVKASNDIRSEERIQLHSFNDTHQDGYKDIMQNNNGFVRATILDVINIIYQHKSNNSWLVMWYDKLTLSKKIQIEELLDGSCTIETKLVWPFRTTTKGISFKVEFQLTHPIKWIVLSWWATLLICV